jgi:hypothetical protein
MPSYTITIKDETLKGQIEDAFEANFTDLGDPNHLTGEALVVSELVKYIKSVLNGYIVDTGVANASANVSEVSITIKTKIDS